MTQSTQADDLQKLWFDLNRDEAEQRAQDLAARLRERADQYAQITEAHHVDDESSLQVLVLRVQDELYGVDVMRVRGVRPLDALTRVPGVPSFYRGVVNVRGQIVSVLDLRDFMDLPDVNAPTGELVIVEGASLYIALLVDRIMTVEHVSKSQITPLDANYARGVTAERLVLLDMDMLLNDKRLIIGGETD